jgi:hypothetical protein
VWSLRLGAAQLLGCVYDFDAYQVGEGGAGSASTSSSSQGGASPSSGTTGTSSTSSTSSTSGGGGEGGASVGGGPLPPCTPAYDFTGFDPGNTPWADDYEVDAASDGGDAYAFVRSNFSDDYGGFWWETPLSPTNCFHSIRVEKEGGTNHGLFAYCDDDYGLRVSFEAPSRYAHVIYSDNSAIPDSAGITVGEAQLEGFRISFGEDVVVSEVRVAGSWTVLDKIARPSWLVNCELGYDMYVGTTDGSHVDDWASDPPDTSIIALP